MDLLSSSRGAPQSSGIRTKDKYGKVQLGMMMAKQYPVKIFTSRHRGVVKGDGNVHTTDDEPRKHSPFLQK